MHKKIINEASDWINTKFKHQGRLKKTASNLGGCDCLGLIIGIAKNLDLKALNGNLLKNFDNITYPQLCTSNILKQQLDELLFKVKIKDIKIGDIILLKINKWPQHLAIISATTPQITIIHSYIQDKKVIEQHLPLNWINKIISIYRFNTK